MKNKTLSLALVISMVFAFGSPSAYATGAKEAGASLFLPTTGQAMNGELGDTKTKVMAGVEVAAITTIAILGGVVGGGIVWVGLGPLIANHAWSATDAYKGAQRKQDPLVQEQMAEAQRMLELSRQKRFEREQTQRSDIRDKILKAGEQTD